MCLSTTKKTFHEDISLRAIQIAEYYSYDYKGIYDIFPVSGDLKIGEALGRTTYYEFTKKKEAKSLASFNWSELQIYELGFATSSLVYFCKNKFDETFTLTTFSLISLKSENIKEEIFTIGNSFNLKNKIKQICEEEIIEIEFIGVEDIIKAEMKFDIFETLYSTLENLDENDLLNENEIEEKLNNLIPLLSNLKY